jgi:hypothetical protein
MLHLPVRGQAHRITFPQALANAERKLLDVSYASIIVVAILLACEFQSDLEI